MDPALARGRKMVSEAATCEAGGAQAPAHCQAACALNHSNSCARSGQWREKAGDMKQAMTFYMKACDGGSGLGCEEAARVRKSGKDGAPANPSTAAALDHKARFYHRVHCQQGFAPSCLGLGRMFLDGRGGPPNRGAAGYFLDKACHMGVKEACGVVAHAGAAPRHPSPSRSPSQAPSPSRAQAQAQ